MDLGYCIKQHQLHNREADIQRRTSSHNLKENDADNCSTISNSQFFNGFDTETVPAPVSVRDMIRRYNSASKMGNAQPVRRQSQFTLSSAKSSFFGVNKFSSNINFKGEQSEDENVKAPHGCRRCNSVRNVDSCNRAPPSVGIVRSASLSADQNRITSLNSKAHSNGESNQECAVEKHNDPNENKDHYGALIKESPSCPRPSIDSLEEVNCQPVEASYQSKTTIAKTSSGGFLFMSVISSWFKIHFF